VDKQLPVKYPQIVKKMLLTKYYNNKISYNQQIVKCGRQTTKNLSWVTSKATSDSDLKFDLMLISTCNQRRE
jgi:hypothetical protein